MLFSASALLSTLLIVASSPLTLAVPTKVEEPRDLRARTSAPVCNFVCQSASGYTVVGSSTGNSGGYQCIYTSTSVFGNNKVTCTYNSSGSINGFAYPPCKSSVGTCSSSKRSFTEAQSELADKIQKRQWKRTNAKDGVAQKRR
ncbi:hypothetical protein [Phaffia rhodozyma]|uniref:Uncharacterized protein n=1 Tax=Phaffia rhodozyma TaxID=264483 RepID=A0A0F7SQ89_PHARH|nr:hypothetical protein [Phaffia rhodozyma]